MGFGGVDGRTKGRLVLVGKLVLFLISIICEFNHPRLRRASGSSSDSWSGINDIELDRDGVAERVEGEWMEELSFDLYKPIIIFCFTEKSEKRFVWTKQSMDFVFLGENITKTWVEISI